MKTIKNIHYEMHHDSNAAFNSFLNRHSKLHSTIVSDAITAFHSSQKNAGQMTGLTNRPQPSIVHTGSSLL